MQVVVFWVVIKVVDTVPVPAILADMYHIGMYTDIEMKTFRTSLNIGCTSHTSQFWALPASTKKNTFFFLVL